MNLAEVRAITGTEAMVEVRHNRMIPATVVSTHAVTRGPLGVQVPPLVLKRGLPRFYGTKGSGAVLVRTREEVDLLVWPRQVLKLTVADWEERNKATREANLVAHAAVADRQTRARAIADQLWAEWGIASTIDRLGSISIPPSNLDALKSLLACAAPEEE